MVAIYPEALIAKTVAERSRLEALFSLHRDSQFTRLNRDGKLANPVPEMLEMLSIASGLNTGEIMALGVAPDGAPWPVTLANTEGPVAAVAGSGNGNICAAGHGI